MIPIETLLINGFTGEYYEFWEQHLVECDDGLGYK